MRKGIEKFVQPFFSSIDGYSARRSPDTLVGKTNVAAENIIKLDANENLYGCSPEVGKALASYPYFNVYPDAHQTELRKALQRYCGAGYENIVVGSGSGDLLDLLLRLFVAPGEEVINLVPTFDMYRVRTELCDGRLREVARKKDFSVAVAGVKAAINQKTKMIILTNPNNPDGGVTPREDIIELLNTGLPVLVDEAYYEFCRETVIPLINEYQNLMVLRTFSKWTGLAGLRVGYGIFPPQIAEYLFKIKLPYNVNVAAQVAVQESLKDIDYLMHTVDAIIHERQRLFEELNKIDFLRPFPSRANFILCVVQNGKAAGLREELQRRGILVRYFNRPMMTDFIRISVGKPEHTDALALALREIGG